MSRFFRGSYLCAALLAGACSAAYADRAAPPRPPPPPHDQAIAIAPEAVRAKYNVDITNENGESLSTYAQKGRYYVLGGAGDRYIVHVTNPSPLRIEAVITVDGLDVIDGEAGDLKKRGYVVPPYGDVRIEGFRTSTENVATFRFSSVAESYAQRKGKGRNVGVIAVAIFEEVPPPADPIMIEPNTRHGGPEQWLDDSGGGDDEDGEYEGEREAPRGGYGAGTTAPSAEKAPADKEVYDQPSPPPPAPTGGAVGRGSAGAPARPDLSRDRSDCCTQHKSRPGLGTEFGETRYSSVSWTKFVRASAKPAAVAELRYNDAAGLTALGILVQPMPDEDELGTRETADPFPGDDHFARPPAGIH